MSAIYPPDYQQSPPQPPPLPPHRSWPRRHKILTALGSGFGLLVVLIIVIVAASAPSVTKASSPPTTAAAPATSAQATPTPTAPPQVTDPSGQACPSLDSAGYCPGDDPATPMDNWCAGNGYSDYSAVQSDISALSADAGNNDLLSVESDGAQLFHHASVAGLNLPPVSDKTQKLDYGLYMGWLLVAGEKASAGDITGADSAFQKAASYKDVVTTVTSACGG